MADENVHARSVSLKNSGVCLSKRHDPRSVFVITAYELRGRAKLAYRRRRRRRGR